MGYNILNMLFPFITSLYVARVLLPTTVGEVNYANNIVQYFVIMAFLGIPTYGLREIAKARDSKTELNKLFSELFTINGISTIVFTLAYYGTVLIVPAFRNNFALYAIVGLHVVMNAFSITWLYEGLEEFGFISARNLIFKTVALIMLFVFVKSDDDMLIYACISVIGTVGNNIVNMIHARKFVKYTPKGMDLKRHMKPIFMLVVVNLAIEIYTLVDTTMLGAMTTKDHVAFYTYASRINKIILQITNSITMVLVPRISYYYGEKQYDDFNALLTKGLKTLIMMAVPMIIGIQFTARYLIVLLYGEAYISSVYVEKILCFVLLISPIGYLLGSRVMLVSGHEDKMIICVGTGAIVNIIGNFFLIRLWGEMGAAVASVISELAVMIIYVNYGRKVFKLQNWHGTVVKILLAGGAEAAVLLLCKLLIPNETARTIAQIISGALAFVIVMYLEKDEVFNGYVKYFTGKLLRRKTDAQA